MLLPLLGYGQSQGRENLFGCDEAVARQDAIVSVALESLSENTFLIVVIRPGVGEVSNQLAARRLSNIKQYFTHRGSRIAGDKVVVATGARTKGLGQVEFYMQGQLADVIAYPRNGFICHSCCGPDTDFYPDKGQVQKSHTRPAKK
jgi:hypothetical protein